MTSILMILQVQPLVCMPCWLSVVTTALCLTVLLAVVLVLVTSPMAAFASLLSSPDPVTGMLVALVPPVHGRQPVQTSRNQVPTHIKPLLYNPPNITPCRCLSTPYCCPFPSNWGKGSEREPAGGGGSQAENPLAALLAVILDPWLQHRRVGGFAARPANTRWRQSSCRHDNGGGSWGELHVIQWVSLISSILYDINQCFLTYILYSIIYKMLYTMC